MRDVDAANLGSLSSANSNGPDLRRFDQARS
jgi:hypothetical protein